MNDDALDLLILQTHPKPKFPASFQREIWARITVAEQQSWTGQWRQWTRHLFFSLARPAPAMAMVTAMLIAGVSLGGLTTPDRKATAMRTAYVTSINPLRAAQVAIHE